MLYLTCTTITSVDLAYYGVYRAKDWVSVNCGTMKLLFHLVLLLWNTVFNILRFHFNRIYVFFKMGFDKSLCRLCIFTQWA